MKRLNAAGIKALALTSAVGALSAAAAGDKAQLRRFAMEAYNGGAMRFDWSDVPVVVDLTGLDLTDKSRPILLDHLTEQRIGHTTAAEVRAAAGQLLTVHVEGVISGTGPQAQEVVGSADNGFPWQASISVDILTAERFLSGHSVTVNGQDFDGPLLVVRTSRLREVSFVALGADDSTQASVIAAAAINHLLQGSSIMTFAEWLASLGIDPATLTEAGSAVLQKAFDAEEAAAKAATEKAPDAPVKASAARKALTAALQEVGRLAAAAKVVKKKSAPVEGDDTVDQLQASRQERVAEIRRVGAISTLCAGKHTDIEAQAIEEGWSAEKTELAVLRASRVSGPNINTGAGSVGITGQVLEAAVCIAGRMSNLDKRYDDNVLEAASKHFRSPISLGQLIIMAARANGYLGGGIKVDRDIMKAAFALQAGGFSTIDVSGILSNVANKSILDAFMAVDQSWRKISAISPVSDFKAVTRYRMTGDNTYELVNAGGEIKNGTLDEESFSNQAKTYAKLLAITRQDLRNDDLGALTKVPKMLGRGAALKLNDVFWTAFLADHATFFPTDNSKLNYFDGATASLLTIDGLSTAEQKFLDQVDANSKPLGITPATLLVPTALRAKADALMKSTEIRDTTASTKAPTGNPHAGKFEVVATPYLNNSTMGGGYSSAAWYLLANPADLAAIETVFLDGQESPTIETAEADFATLGIQMRGFHDFGVAKQDYRAAVKSKGAA